jgi:hypothetical protein
MHKYFDIYKDAEKSLTIILGLAWVAQIVDVNLHRLHVEDDKYRIAVHDIANA